MNCWLLHKVERKVPYRCLKTNIYGDAQGYQLVPLRGEDREPIRLWRNAQQEILRQHVTLSQEDQDRYFSLVLAPLYAMEQPPQILFSYLLEDRLIGYGGLVHIQWPCLHAELSFLVDPARKAFYETDFLHYLGLITQAAFQDLAFHRLFAETFAFRTDHMAVLEKFGFKREGVLREHIYKQGTWVDSHLHGLLARECHV